MPTSYLASRHFPSLSTKADELLALSLEDILASDFHGDMYAMLASYQRILADNHKRHQWPAIHNKLEVLFKCGRETVVDGPMIGIPVSIRDSDYFQQTVERCSRKRSLSASIEWMATAWNMTFADTGLWMGKTFEPVSKEVVRERTGGAHEIVDQYDQQTNRIGRNFFREPPRPNLIQSLGLPVLTEIWNLKPRPESIRDELFGGQLIDENLAKEAFIPYSMTGGVFLASPGTSAVPSMQGKQVYQLNYRWANLGPAYPMTRLIDELVQIAEGIYLGQLVFATHHYSLGIMRRPLAGPDRLEPQDQPPLGLFDEYVGRKDLDYGYQNNGYFLMLDPAYARQIYADTAFPQLRPRPDEHGFKELGYDKQAVSVRTRSSSTSERWPSVRDWLYEWRADDALQEKFTTFLLEESSKASDRRDVRQMRQEDESILQMLQRISRDVSANTTRKDQLQAFEPLHQLFRCGVAPKVMNGCFQGHGKSGYNCRVDGKEPRDWYGQAEVAHSFDYYHGANLNLHCGFSNTLQGDLTRDRREGGILPGVLAALLADGTLSAPNALDLVWHSIGKYIFPWAGKSFERINGRKLSMLLDESENLARRYPVRVGELRTHLASAPHYSLVEKAAGRYWKEAGMYADHLAEGPWDNGMSDLDKAFWAQEAASHWVDGNNIQDERILAADPLMRVIDMNYRVPDSSLQTLSEAGPSPFARQGYIFLGASDRDSILDINNDGLRKKKVFQFHYRFPMIGGPAPIGYCLDELVEIADGLFLGQLIYATALDVPFHSSVDPAQYNYQLFGYFLLMDDAWEYHRQAIGLDVWRR